MPRPEKRCPTTTSSRATRLTPTPTSPSTRTNWTTSRGKAPSPSTSTNSCRSPTSTSFVLQSKSSVQSLLHAAIFPYPERVHHTSVCMRFICTPNFGVPVLLRIFIQLRKYDGRLGTSHLCFGSDRPESAP